MVRSLTQWTKTLSFPAASSNKSNNNKATSQSKLIAAVAPSCASLHSSSPTMVYETPQYAPMVSLTIYIAK